MSKITGFELNNHRPYEAKNKETGEVTTKYLDNVTIYVSVKAGKDEAYVERCGNKFKEYVLSTEKEKLESIFDRKITNVSEFLKKQLEKECFIETTPRSYFNRTAGQEVLMGEEVVSITFLEDLIAK